MTRKILKNLFTSKDVRGHQSGSVFFAMFGTVALVGVAGAASMQVMKGPVRAMSEVTKRTIAENGMIASAKLAVVMATVEENKGDCDKDGFVEPMPFDEGDGFGPVGGGYLPISIGASLNDPWGTRYGYCVWDHGSVQADSSCENSAGASNRLEGVEGKNQILLAVISAGPDRQFQTRCLNAADADAVVNGGNNNGIVDGDEKLIVKISGSDDIVFDHTYMTAESIGGELWYVDAGKATIGEDIEVKNASNEVVFGLDRGSGHAEFLAIKADHILARTTNGAVSLNDPLRILSVFGMDPPAGNNNGGGS